MTKPTELHVVGFDKNLADQIKSHVSRPRIESTGQAIYKISGSLAALVKEQVWEDLLKGKVVGVMEPDPEKYSLFINGEYVKTITAKTEQRLTIKAERAIRAWRAIPGNILQNIEIDPGFPNMISIPPDRIKKLQEHGLDAKKCANKVREFIKNSCGNLDKFLGIFTFLDEIDRGMTREGKD